MKYRQDNGQKINDNRTNNDVQNITQKTENQRLNDTNRPSKTRGKLRSNRRLSSSFSTSGIRLVTKSVIRHE
jgi:hypothetical protein